MSLLNFNAAQVQPDTGRPDPVPADWYNAMMVASEMKPTKDQSGAYLEAQCKIVDGPYAGRVIYDRMNLQNANATAVEIGYKRLSAYCHATGVIQVQDSAQLHNIPFRMKVKLKPADGQYEASNEVSAIKNLQDPSAYPQGAAAPAQGGFPAQQQAFTQQAPAFQQPVQQPQQPAQQPAWAQGQQQPTQQAPVQQPAQQPQFQPQQGAQQPWQQPNQQAPVQQPQQQPAQQPQGGAPVPPWAQG